MDIEKVKEIIAKHAHLDKNTMDLNAEFKNDLHLDSIDLFQMIMEIEDTFNIKIENDQLLDIITINDALTKIKNAK